MFKNTRGFLFAAFTALALSACGGGSVGNGGTDPGPDPDPTGPSSTPTAVVLVTTSDVLRSDADTAAEGAALTAIVTDANGNTVSGAEVVFQLVAPNNSGALVIGNSTTGSDGTARATLTTGGNAVFPRTIAVRARVGTINSVTRNFTVVSSATPVDPVEISEVAIFASSPVLRADADTAEEGVTLTAVVTNSDGNVVPNVPVTFSRTLDSGSGTPGNLQVTRGTTDSSGTAVAILTTSGNTSPRTIRVRARATSEGVDYDDDIQINVVAVASRVDGTISSARLPNNDSAPVTARARAVDANGNPAANVPVTFFVSSGRIFPGTTAPAAGTPAATATSATVTTGANGETGLVTIDTAGNRTPRVITVTMTAPGAEADTADIAVVPAVAATGGIQLRSTSAALKADADTSAEALALTAVLIDDDGNLISGEPVTFRITSGVGSLQVVRGTSDDSGTAVVNLTNGGNTSFPRNITVEARAQNRTSTRVIGVVDPNTPAEPIQVSRVDLFASARQLFNDADTADEGLTVTAVLTNDNGNVVKNVPVSFSIVSGLPAALQVTRDTTDTTGTAAALLHTSGNATPRNITVRASIVVNGATLSRDLTIPVVVRASALALTVSSPRLPSETNAPVTVSARATDASGNPLANVPVTIALASGSPSTTTANTDATGRTPLITITNGGDPTPRTIVISASAPGVTTTTATVDVVSTANAPAAIVLVSTTDTLRADAVSVANGVPLTAIVTDSSGNTVSGATVVFQLVSPNNAGALTVTAAVTRADGTAAAVLTTGGNATFPRTISVRARVSSIDSATRSFSVVNPNTPVDPVQVSNVDLFASAQQLFNDADTTAEGVTVTAVVTNDNGNVVNNVPVSFSILPGSTAALQVTRGTTDATGTATAVLHTSGNATPRNITLRATVEVNGTTLTRNLTIPVVVRASALTLTLTSQRLPSATNAPVTLSARATDASGNPLANVPVTITLNSGAASATTATTDATGRTPPITITNGGDPSPRTIVIAASAPGVTASTATVEVVPVVSELSLLSSATTLRANAVNPADGVRLTAVLADSDGAAIAGETVAFRVASGDGLLAVIQAVTDDSGAATAVLTTLNPIFPRNISVQASAQGQSDALTIGVVDPNTPTTPIQVSAVDLFGSASVLRADADTAEEGLVLTAVVTNISGNVVSGVPVNFTLLSGTPASLQVTRNTTDGTGTATAVLTTAGNTSARSIQIRATVTVGGSTITNTLTVPVVGAATTINGTISSTRLPSNNSGVPLTARARAVNEDGNLIPNVPVTFFVSSGRIYAGTTPPVSADTSVTVTTGANGETGVVRIDTAGDPTPRTITVTMTGPGAKADSIDVEVVQAVNDIQLLSSSSSLKADADTAAEALALTAVLTDSNGNLVVGEPVTFRVSAGSGALQVVRGITDETGTAVANLTTGGVSTFPRTITVEAKAQDTTETRTINVVDPASPVTPLPVAAVNLFSSSAVLFSDADTAAEGAGLSAVVTDNNGNVVANVPVSFSLSLQNGSGTPGALQVLRNTTDATGVATAVLTTSGNTSIRTVRVTATVTVGGTPFTDFVDLPVVGRASNLLAIFSGTTLFSDNSQPVTVRVRAVDGFGNAVANVPVSLNVTSGSLSQTEVTTDSNGLTPLVTLSTGGDATPRVIRFNAIAAGGGVSATGDIQVIPAVDNLLLTSSTPRIIDGSSDPTATLTALVRSSEGNVLSGIPVRFVVAGPPGTNRNGAVQVLGSGISDESGRVRATLSLGNTLPGDTLAVTAIYDRQPPLAQVVSILTVQVGSQVATLELLSSSNQLSSAANSPANGVELTALLKDPDQNVVPNANVSFAIVSGDIGLLTPIRTTTDAAGTAQAVLTTSNDPTDRTIRVRATSGTTSSIVTITVVGTRLSISGPSTAQTGVAAEYVATLVDDAGRGIANRTVTLASDSGSVTPTSAMTNLNGQVTFQLTAGSAPNALLTATALNGTEIVTKSISVTNDSLVFVDDDANAAPVYNPPEASLSTPVDMRVVWTRLGAPVVGKQVTFSSSRGFIVGASVATTDMNGAATVVVRSEDAGQATVIARGLDTVPDPDSTPIAIQPIVFNATVPATVSIEAEPTVIGPNQQSTVTAVVRDARDNLVGNSTVNFRLSDTTRGSLSAGSAVTDAQGRASVVYTASSTPSALNGVQIDATVAGSPASVNDTVFITVGSRSARIVLGTGNTISESADESRYILPYSAIVTDNAGNPAPDATLRLTLNPKFYYKGYYIENLLRGIWEQVITAECVAEDTNGDGIMQNEDTNRNGMLDVGEDTNGNGSLDQEDINFNGQLDPSNPGAPNNTSPTLDASGIAEFNINYPQDRGLWTGVQLTARASVSGTEAIERANFVLLVLAADLQLANGTPPGQPSPFGVLSRCDRDDTLVPFVRVQAASGGITVTEPTATATSTVNVTFELVQPRTPATYNDTIVATVGVDFTGISLSSQADIGDDFILPTSQITFLPGQTTATLPVTINRDFDVESAESFNIRLQEVVTNNGVITAGAAQRAVITINPPP